MASLPVAALLFLDAVLLTMALSGSRKAQNRAESILIAILFFCSGFPALIYQIVWQRALFVIYGVNVQSVAVVVSAFMLGLGLGSLAGGWLSSRFPNNGIVIFGICELAVAIFGLASLHIFQWAARYTAGSGLGSTIIFSFLLLIVPTMLMGATLPLLVEQLVNSSRNVGYSVATLYFVNTLGSAVACYLCAQFLMRGFGQSGSVTIAACINLVVGTTAYIYGRSRAKETGSEPAFVAPEAGAVEIGLPTGAAMLIAGVVGFVALGFEIEWFRVLALAAADRAPVFALLLATYLGGIAAGSYLAEKFTENKSAAVVIHTMAMLLLIAGAISVYLPPLVAELSWKGYPAMYSAPAFFVTAGLLGSVLPLLCQLAVAANEKSGQHVSLIYVSNIIGSTLGSLGIGFVLMNYYGLKQTSMQLALLAVAAGILVLSFAKRRFQARQGWGPAAMLASLLMIFISSNLYSNLFGRLIFGPKAATTGYMAHVVENRNGVIAVTPDGAVMGEGVYDGYFNIDPLDDKNLVVRAYALSLFHPSPKRILMIGLASGSWGQILVNHPQVESLDIVEINPGYLPLIKQYPMVSSLLRNPKAHIFIDDGRRWLLAHPEARYDVIAANTSFYWRDHSSVLLSADFLQLVQRHLNSGGIFYYNTTSSPDVQVTGLHVFPYGLRVINFMAVSDSPIILDKGRWMSVLRQYKIDDQPVFDPANSRAQLTLAAYMALADTVKEAPRDLGLEAGDVLAARLGARHIITDDNMGEEWMADVKPTWR
jgi:spermidine synthase